MPHRKSIDDRDAQLLQMLDLNARITLTEIGKRLRISKPAAKRRLERLEEAGIVRRYVTIINLSALGHTIHKIHLKFGHMDDAGLASYAEHLKSFKETGWIMACIGRWDFVILLYTRNARHLAETYRRLVEPVADKVAKKRVTVVASLTHLPHDVFLKKQPQVRSRIQLRDTGEQVELDRLDNALLDALSLDARATYVKLSTKLMVTPKTIRNRIKRLEKEGVILGYNAVLDTERIGYEHHRVSIYLTEAKKETFKRLQGYIESLPETILFVDSLGDADIEFDLKVNSTARLHGIISELRQRFTGIVRNVDTLLITDEDIRDYTPHF